MRKMLLTGLLIMSVSSLFAQDNATASASSASVKMHRVALGETVVLIAKKYMVTPKDIYDLNPDAVNGISANQSLKIPMDKSIPIDEPEEQKVPVISRPVAKKGTSNNGPAPEVTSANEPAPALQKPVQIETRPVTVKEEAALPENTGASISAASLSPVTHLVKGGETLTGLARKYNTTIARITGENSRTLKRGLQIGQMLHITPGAPGDDSPQQAQAVAEPTTSAVAEAKQPNIVYPSGGSVEHHVSAGETLHSLARRYQTTVDAITNQNKKILRRGLQTGQTLHINAGTANTQ